MSAILTFHKDGALESFDKDDSGELEITTPL